MNWFRKSSVDLNLKWIPLTSEDQFLKILEEDHAAIFKHSTRCSISTMAKNRLEQGLDEDQQMSFYYLDVLRYRPVSNLIEETLGVGHQSPQLIVLKNGNVIHHASHSSISPDNFLASIS